MEVARGAEGGIELVVRVGSGVGAFVRGGDVGKVWSGDGGTLLRYLSLNHRTVFL